MQVMRCEKRRRERERRAISGRANRDYHALISWENSLLCLPFPFPFPSRSPSVAAAIARGPPFLARILLAPLVPDLFDKQILECGAQRGIARVLRVILIALAEPAERGAHGASGLRLSRAGCRLTSTSCST